MSKNELVIYRSSAGSGKTYTLVFEYLKLVLQNPTLYRSILAITFTNKATEEMKSRIVEALVSIAENLEPELQKSIHEQTGIPIQQLPAKAGQVIENILHDYSGFAVSTIDSFFSKMVRSLARELHLPLRFNIELDITSVISEITSMLFDDISKDPWLRKWLQNFVFDKLENEKGWQIEKEIHKIAQQLFDDKYRTLFSDGIRKPENELIGELKKLIHDYENKMMLYGKQFSDIAAENNLMVEDFHYGKTGVANYFIKIRQKVKDNDYLPGKRFLDAAESEDLWAAKKSLQADVVKSLAISKFMPLANEILKLIKNENARYKGALAVIANAYEAGVIGALDEKLKVFRDENEIVLLTDTNRILSRAISGQDTPFIYEKSGNRYSHFMLDEFQDTSDFQWQNLAPLIENSIGSGNYTLIVGDAKQSIYRWRGGNMNLLLNGIKSQFKHFDEITRTLRLESNYRSREVIVSFNNKFYSKAPFALDLQIEEGTPANAYNSKDITQEWKKGEVNDGYLKIILYENKNKKKKHVGSHEENEEDASWKEHACMESLLTLQKLFEAGYEPGDIAFLTRKNSDAKEITTFLLNNGVDKIISPESMQLYHSPKILFLVNLLSFINNQQDQIALAHINYYWNIVCQPETAPEPDNLFSRRKYENIQTLPDAFTKRLLEFRKIPLYEVVEELLIIFKLNTNPEAFTQRFLDLILEYSSSNPSNINDFLLWWDENLEKDNCSVIVPSGENAIRVMSIHKSKGLQFPVVIIPFADWSLTPHKEQTMWVSNDQPPFNSVPAHPVRVNKKLESSIFEEDFDQEVLMSKMDNLNMLYVATTRAEEQLYIFAQLPKESSNNSINTTSKLIYSILQSDEQWSQQLVIQQNCSFESGKFSSPFRKKNKSRVTGENLSTWVSEGWKGRLQILISKKKISVYDPEPPDTIYGTLFHEIASSIYTADTTENVVDNYIKKNKVDESMRTRLINDINYFVTTSIEQGWFEENVETLNETELLLTDGSLLRPDRVIIKKNEVLIIDYKTGTEEKHHLRQLESYAGVLKQMGYSNIKTILIYPSLGKIVSSDAA